MERSKKKISTTSNFMTWEQAPLTSFNIPFKSLSMFMHTSLSQFHIYIHILILFTYFYICMYNIYPLQHYIMRGIFKTKN